MSLIVTLSGSSSHPSRSQLLAELASARLRERGFQVQSLNVRDLPAQALVHGRIDDAGLRAALDLIERADGVVLSTPIYKASFSGVLKSFLDLLPQFGLAGKVALPLATGGTLAHVLAIDYALRPVLAALSAQHVTTGLFLLDRLIERRPEGPYVDPDLEKRLHLVVDEFAQAVARSRLAVAQTDAALPPAPAAPEGVNGRSAPLA